MWVSTGVSCEFRHNVASVHILEKYATIAKRAPLFTKRKEVGVSSYLICWPFPQTTVSLSACSFSFKFILWHFRSVYQHLFIYMNACRHQCMRVLYVWYAFCCCLVRKGVHTSWSRFIACFTLDVPQGNPEHNIWIETILKGNEIRIYTVVMLLYYPA